MQTRLQDILADSDRQGERQIALFQALMAMIALPFLLFDTAGQGFAISAFAPAMIAGTIILSSLLRIRFSRKINQCNYKLHWLTVIDGALIFSLVISFPVVRDLPLDTTFTTPTIVFLVAYAGIRVLRFDPLAVAIAGTTVLAGWSALIVAASLNGAVITGPLQMGVGFAAMLAALVVSMAKARKILGSAAHVSELEAANRTAEDHIAQHEELLHSSIDAILIVDEEGRIERANPAFQSLFGYSEADLVGRSAAMLMSSRHAAALEACVRQYIATGSSDLVGRSFESEGLDANGGTIAIDISISPFFSGGKQRFAGFIRDARSRKEQERQLKREKERAEFANRAKASFLAMMSHEVRTPLHGLLGILDLLMTTTDERDRAELISVAQNSGTALLQIINDILDFSKLDEGKLSIVKEPFEVAKLSQGVFSLVRPLAAEKGLMLECRCEGPLPPVLLGDSGRIRQILLNLTTNAIKFTERGSVVMTVENRGTQEAPRMRFAVADTGKGIDLANHHLVFREFETMGAPFHARQAGTGLGLAICKRLVDAMGGRIGFSSVAGQGSTFWFELPMQQAQERRQSPRKPGDEFPPADLHGLKVLAVEDNCTNQLLLRRNLEVLGVLVDIAGDGESALQALETAEYDAVLMDISMPGMDGISATAAIRAKGGRFGALPVIMMSAYAYTEDRERAFAAGATGYMAKPVMRADLARALTRTATMRKAKAAGHDARLASMAQAADALKEAAAAARLPAVELEAARLGAELRCAPPADSCEAQSLGARSARLLRTISEEQGRGAEAASERQAR